jgi:5-methylcytosine-specific restriction endonuclease McrA
VPLEVEHVVALYNGGTNDDSNLVAACHDCNQGKGPGRVKGDQYG